MLGGSVTNWRRASSSGFRNGGHIQDQLAGTTDEIIEASVADLYAGRGGLVSYPDGHQYSGNTENDLNGQRQFLNAFLTPATTCQGCNVFADLSGNVLAANLRYTICRGDSVQIQLPVAGAQRPRNLLLGARHRPQQRQQRHGMGAPGQLHRLHGGGHQHQRRGALYRGGRDGARPRRRKHPLRGLPAARGLGGGF